MRKRDRDVSELEPKALEGKFVGYTEGDNGYLVYVPNTRKVVAVRDVIIKESEVGSIPDNTETPDLLDEGSQQLGLWDPDNGHQDDGNKEEQGTSTAIKEEWHDAESLNTHMFTIITLEFFREQKENTAHQYNPNPLDSKKYKRKPIIARYQSYQT